MGNQPSERTKAAAKVITRFAVTLQPERAIAIAQLVLLDADKADRKAGIVRVPLSDLCEFDAREAVG